MLDWDQVHTIAYVGTGLINKLDDIRYCSDLTGNHKETVVS